MQAKKQQDISTPALLSGKTLGEGNVTIHENVAYKLNVRNIEGTAANFQAAGCDL